MDENKTTKISLGTAISIVIIILLVFALGIVYYLGFIKNNNEISKLSNEKQALQKQISSLQEEKKTTTQVNINQNTYESKNEEKSEDSMTKQEATKIIQDIYGKAYDNVQEGIGLKGTSLINISVGNEGTVGGVINAEAYKLDFSKIEPYFTERAIKYIKTEYTDTPYGHKDGNYYIFADENIYSYSKKEFINTIFGVTDQGKRTFDVKLYDDNMIVAVSEKSSFFELDEYIVLRKINDTWKIDMFEEL